MARGDLRTIGPVAIFPRYMVAGGTSIEAGEPIHSTSTNASGLATGGSLNSYVLAAADTPIIATHKFGGVANESSENRADGAVVQQFLNAACPVPGVGRIRGRAETVGSVDTLTELALLIQDTVLIDYNSTGGVGSTQLYTIKEAGTADTSGLEIVGGNTALATLDVTIDFRAYRHDIAT